MTLASGKSPEIRRHGLLKLPALRSVNTHVTAMSFGLALPSYTRGVLIHGHVIPGRGTAAEVIMPRSPTMIIWISRTYPGSRLRWR
jgi:hypothetical protein